MNDAIHYAHSLIKTSTTMRNVQSPVRGLAGTTAWERLTDAALEAHHADEFDISLTQLPRVDISMVVSTARLI
jgi:hypothetical protein